MMVLVLQVMCVTRATAKKSPHESTSIVRCICPHLWRAHITLCKEITDFSNDEPNKFESTVCVKQMNIEKMEGNFYSRKIRGARLHRLRCSESIQSDLDVWLQCSVIVVHCRPDELRRSVPCSTLNAVPCHCSQQPKHFNWCKLTP